MSQKIERAAGRYVQPALQETLTCEQLESALRDESVAGVECGYFARIAEIEGEPELARALREIGEQHAINARGTLDLLMRAREPLTGKAMGDSRMNVTALAAFYACDAEAEQSRSRTAMNEGFADISSWFTSQGRLRAAHAARLSGLLAGLRSAESDGGSK